MKLWIKHWTLFRLSSLDFLGFKSVSKSEIHNQVHRLDQTASSDLRVAINLITFRELLGSLDLESRFFWSTLSTMVLAKISPVASWTHTQTIRLSLSNLFRAAGFLIRLSAVGSTARLRRQHSPPTHLNHRRLDGCHTGDRSVSHKSGGHSKKFL